jgi:hypothetical protein
VAAALVGTYWFAFLHAPLNPVVVLLLGTIQVLPMTYLWLRRGLEAAIGFHVCVDVVRFLAGYAAFAGIWFRGSTNFSGVGPVHAADFCGRVTAMWLRIRRW